MNRLNTTVEHVLRVVVNNQQNDWVKCLRMTELTSNNGMSEITKCTPCIAVQCTDPDFGLSGEPRNVWDHRFPDADQVLAPLPQIHEHLRVKIRRTEVQQQQGQ